jgi:hypothetical protein
LFACVSTETSLVDDPLPPGPDAVESAGDAPTRSVQPYDGDRLDPDPLRDPQAPAPDDPDADAFYAEGTLHDIRLTLPDTSRASLALAPRVAVDATFATGGHAWPVGVRLKGTTTFRTLDGKPAFKVDFDHTDPEGRFRGRKRLTLNSMLQDSSMLHEHVSYWLYRHRGVPAPRHTFARVWVNSAYYGIYGVVETMDEQFLDTAFPDDDDGTLYEGNLSDFEVGHERQFEVEEAADTAVPYVDLEALTATLAAAPDDGFLAALDATFDLDALLRFLAIDLVSGNVDGYSRFRNNYLVYHAVLAGRWYLVPWGHDQAMQWHRAVGPYEGMQGHLLQRCGVDPACAERLTTEIQELMVEWEDGPFIQMVSDTTSLIQRECAADPRAELPCDASHVLAFVLARPETVRAELAE